MEALLEQVRKKYSVNRPATLERLARSAEEQKKTLALREQWKSRTPEEIAEEDRIYAEIERDGISRFNIPD